MALSFFLTVTKIDAAAYPKFGPQPFDDDYLFWGNDEFPKTQSHGLTLTIQENSISFQSIIGAISLEYVPNSTLIDQREITRFYIIANGRVVDYFDAAWDGDTEKWRTYYPLRIALEDWNIGSLITLQVIAVTHQEDSPIHPDYQNQYVVAWSNVMGPYQLKPLPVIDRDAIEVLEMILAKLAEIKSTMEVKLNAVQKAVEDIYTPSPAAEAQLQAAMDRLQDKLPMQEIFENVDEMNETLEESLKKMKKPGEELTLGGEFEMIPGVAASKVKFMDLTKWKEQLLLFRKICEAAIWVYFFYMLLEKITPKPRL